MTGQACVQRVPKLQPEVLAARAGRRGSPATADKEHRPRVRIVAETKSVLTLNDCSVTREVFNATVHPAERRSRPVPAPARPPGSCSERSGPVQDVRIFDGVNDDLVRGNVLVEGDTIARISSSDIAPPASAVVIEGANRILTPGFIDLHAHLTMAVPRNQMDAHPWVIGAAAGNAARSYLMSGFTTVRDGGGTHPSFARAVESGLLAGPRIFPSGAVVTQTSGHGDRRARSDPHPVLSASRPDPWLNHGFSVIADAFPSRWRRCAKTCATALRRSRSWAGEEPLPTTIRFTPCSRRPRRSGPRFRRRVTGDLRAGPRLHQRGGAAPGEQWRQVDRARPANRR